MNPLNAAYILRIEKLERENAALIKALEEKRAEFHALRCKTFMRQLDDAVSAHWLAEASRGAQWEAMLTPEVQNWWKGRPWISNVIEPPQAAVDLLNERFWDLV